MEKDLNTVIHVQYNKICIFADLEYFKSKKKNRKSDIFGTGWVQLIRTRLI